ncbi:MAG: hypothetical protein EOO02_21665, partial [Chitinophagaceae bacterium]
MHVLDSCILINLTNHRQIPFRAFDTRQSIRKFDVLPAASQAWFLLASIHAEKARDYNPGTNETNRYEWLEAKAICEKIISVKDSSEGKANAQNLLTEILEKEMSLELEKVNLPGKPFLAYTGFRNIGKLYFRLVNISKKTKDSLLEKQDSDYWRKIVSLQPMRQFEQSLPDTKDHQRHTTEIKIDALPVGQYALIASTTPGFELDKNPLAVHYLYVSGIAWINKRSDHFVLDRENGSPIAGATVQSWFTRYDYTNRKNTETKGPRVVTDKNGFFNLEPVKPNDSRGYKLEINTANDQLFMDDLLYSYYRNVENKIENIASSFLFLDRSIYRPGQTVFFKGIVVSRNTKTGVSTIVPGSSSTIELYGANGEKISSLEVSTNEYGSFSGQFVLPAGVM